jgi:hypothetical protein
MWVAIHKCMEAMVGTSLHSYLYLKLAKTLCLSYFLFNEILHKRVEQVLPGSWDVAGGGRWLKQCTHM